MAPSNAGKNSSVSRLIDFDAELAVRVPQFHAFFSDEDSFIEFRAKARPDGTILVVAKQYGSDGGPMVSFGVGYGVTAALLAIESTIAGGHWRVDVPWEGGKK